MSTAGGGTLLREAPPDPDPPDPCEAAALAAAAVAAAAATSVVFLDLFALKAVVPAVKEFASSAFLSIAAAMPWLCSLGEYWKW